jgi:hypothetical protein
MALKAYRMAFSKLSVMGSPKMEANRLPSRYRYCCCSK